MHLLRLNLRSMNDVAAGVHLLRLQLLVGGGGETAL